MCFYGKGYPPQRESNTVSGFHKRVAAVRRIRNVCNAYEPAKLMHKDQTEAK
ncbi:hypothetical protein GGI26_002408 [Coemansia sp. RSA 1358]|uniref:Uncharacterized protein n=1 Tax=Coemansia umbellata TaxID=1424467 RepID=A0ABQ8PQB7_9FUNG|nr:hypothetical protein EDC05_002924 [Coemansia umbellata]KAJ2623370.1 hypothetical protein GGI26_002408 [Coemansia sp. RSA 1358]